MAASATMTVTVNDVNEAPVFAADTYTGNVAENAIVNENVVTVKATDEDDTDTPAYAITGGNTNDDFKIAASGLIAVAKSLVGKGGDTYTLTVTASDDESPTPLKDDATVTITVTATAAPAVNQPPTFADAMREVAENAAAGSNVGAAVQAADPESDAITYAITGGNTGDVFAIDNNGQITIAQGKSLDHEGTGSYTLTVTATDAAGSNTTVQAAITITVNDVNEAPVFATDAYTRDVPENTAVDVPIGVTVSATDEDDTDTPTYEITGGNTNDDFKIDTNTGVISVAKDLTGK
ncbi:MAG: cadherin repeat domain-containing protein, partial [Ekhidna sp.]|nr:cadherin repeat domain-containing protein [Ekhidna sp.]